MGIHGIYKEIGPGQRIALSKLAVEKFEETGRPLRIAIDVSIWLFQIQASKGGTNPALRTFYYRLLRLIALSIHPIFVFDGPNKPPFKRNKRTGPNVASIPEFLAKQLLKQFAFPIHHAPGEAEAECALLQREGIVDAVLSEDVDTLMFGSGITIRNWSPEGKSNKTPTHVNLYDAQKTKSGPAGLDREGMVLVALMSGGDYIPEGIPGCGPKTACEAARAGFGSDLCEIRMSDKTAMTEWRDRLRHELKTNESKFFKRKHGALVIPDDFPRLDILGYYTHPAISTQAALDKLKQSVTWDRELDYPGLRDFTKDAFDWAKLEGAKHFVRSLAPSLLIRSLRMRGEKGCEFVSDDTQAIQEDEALLIKSIHGKREHAITDNTTELRVSFTPADLVKINLENEDPDEELPAPESAQQEGPELDMDEATALELEDTDDVPKKRAPTKFDPMKPARVWVLETYVKVGAPLKVQDWEAGLLKPKRLATARETSRAPKTKGSKRTKPANDASQATMDSFARVTKPGIRSSQTLTKAKQTSQVPRGASLPPATQRSKVVVELLSSSPAPVQQIREKSLSPVLELPSSVSKRRQRGSIQRSHTLPTNLSDTLERPSTPAPPPDSDVIETLDLVSSPALASPFPKKAKTRAVRNPPVAHTTRQKSVLSSPGSGRTRQTTLDAWSRASPAASPSKTRRTTPPASTIPAPPQFQMSSTSLRTLDLTLSSPRNSPPRKQTTLLPNPGRSDTRQPSPRPPLQSISLNSSFSSTTSNAHKPFIPASIPQRTSPRVRRSKPPELDTLDLTGSDPPLPSTSSFTYTHGGQSISTQSIPSASTPIQMAPTSLRRSPRNSILAPSFSPSKSPPAAWKTHSKKSQTTKKRDIILRESLAGAWTYIDAEGLDGRESEVPKGKARQKWRESQIEVLDLT